ncbi:MAG TPA: isoprenyl transferase [Bacillota bacterium]|nr:isoprenyl transferase [Bacillota bacterium]
MANFFNRFKSGTPKTNSSNQTPVLQAIPQHVAIIMDGNGRWANEQGLPRTAGHRAGLERIRDAVTLCLEVGVKHLTLYAFSTENWKRPQDEVGFLMNLFEEALMKEVNLLHQQGVRVKFIGFRTGLSPSLVKLMEESETKTANNQSLTLNFAINYGGRPEILNACREIAVAVKKGELDPGQVTEELFSGYLFTAGQPDPDLLIKPGKEVRISNFLIWQLAYSEFYFSELYWPEFGKDALMEAFKYYGRKERRFGGIKRGDTAECIKE